MAKTTQKLARLMLPARIRGKRDTSCDFSARIAFIDRIADLPGIETIERNDETPHGRVDIYLRGDASDRALKRRPAPKICSLDCNHITVSGLNRWDRYQVLANGWGKLVGGQVYVHLPRDQKELEIVWSIIRRAYDRLFCPPVPEAESVTITTWDYPKFSRTSLQ